MFLTNNKKNIVYPGKPHCPNIKWGFAGVVTRTLHGLVNGTVTKDKHALMYVTTGCWCGVGSEACFLLISSRSLSLSLSGKRRKMTHILQR